MIDDMYSNVKMEGKSYLIGDIGKLHLHCANNLPLSEH